MKRLWQTGAVVALTIIGALGAEGGVYTYYHENVLGTDLELQVQVESAVEGKAAETRVLAEIDRLAGILSAYDENSELQAWKAQAGASVPVSPELMEVLQASDHWRTRTGGAFDPGVALLAAVWGGAATSQRLPTALELSEARQSLQQARWQVDLASGTAVSGTEAGVSLDGLAKGFIIDRACEAAMARGVSGVLVNIGGDLRAVGTLGVEAGIANPFADAEGSTAIAKTPVTNLAMATSGGSHRYTEINGQRYSHIYDPRTGLPADSVASATVVAPRAVDADALATALNVLSPAEGTALVESVEGAASLIVGRDGVVTRSQRWQGPAPDQIQLAANTPMDSAATWAGQNAVSIDFELANPDTDGRYRRPYIGIWVCDHEGFPIRTLLLWRQKGGLRWLPSLREWYRDDQIRAFVDDTDLIETMSRSTRPPGKYGVVWDGKDDAGQPVPFGTYTIRIEAAREHGTHQVMRAEIELGQQAFTKELEGNVEVSGARISYGPQEVDI